MSIYTRDDVERVGRYREAHCPECDAEYAAHRDGHCPQCGAELSFSPDYAALVVAGYEGIVRQHARDAAPSEDDDYPTCARCAEDTPLALEAASDVTESNRFEAAVEDAEDAVEALGVDAHWVRSELADAYTEAFHDACADPAHCWVCREAPHSDDLECGHDRHRVECPAR